MSSAITSGVLDLDALPKPIIAITVSLSSIGFYYLLLWLGGKIKLWFKAMGVAMQVLGMPISRKCYA